eukprot:2261757-Rhodomonas_salina.2
MLCAVLRKSTGGAGSCRGQRGGGACGAGRAGGGAGRDWLESWKGGWLAGLATHTPCMMSGTDTKLVAFPALQPVPPSPPSCSASTTWVSTEEGGEMAMYRGGRREEGAAGTVCVCVNGEGRGDEVAAGACVWRREGEWRRVRLVRCVCECTEEG